MNFGLLIGSVSMCDFAIGCVHVRQMGVLGQDFLTFHVHTEKARTVKVNIQESITDPA